MNAAFETELNSSLLRINGLFHPSKGFGSVWSNSWQVKGEPVSLCHCA